MGERRTALTFLLVLSSIVSTFSIPIVRATEDSWTTLEPMPTARSSLGVAVVDGKIYAIGGWNGSYLAINEMYDPDTDTWTTKQSMPTERTGPAIAVFNNKIYVIGGIIGESNPSYSGYTGITEVYDPLTDTWETKKPMPTASAYLDANVVGDKIYLITGLTYSDVYPFQGGTDKNQVYDPTNDSWNTKSPIPSGNWAYTSAVVDNKIYVMGAGLTQIYDPETDIWASGTPSPTLVLAAAAGATTGMLAPKKIYLLSGTDEDIDQKNIAANLTQVYDPETDTWTTGTPIPTPRWGLGVAVVNDELYAIGGYNGDIRLAVNEKYTPTDYIPEFPSWVILPLFMMTTLAVLFCRKKMRKKMLR
jgi:N-acetylneuraminic acid mutarotase